MGTASLEPGLGDGAPVELGEDGVLPAPPPEPPPEPEPEPEVEVEVELGVATGVELEPAGVLVHLPLWQAAVEVTMTVELPWLAVPRLAVPVIMGWVLDEAAVPVIWCMALSWTSGSACVKVPAWTPAARARRATEANFILMVKEMELS